jgi:hypothetical protein
MCLSSSAAKDEFVHPGLAPKLSNRPEDKFGVGLGLCFFPVKVRPNRLLRSFKVGALVPDTTSCMLDILNLK